MKIAFLTLVVLLAGNAWAADDRFCDVSPVRPELQVAPLHPVLNVPRGEIIA